MNNVQKKIESILRGMEGRRGRAVRTRSPTESNRRFTRRYVVDMQNVGLLYPPYQV